MFVSIDPKRSEVKITMGTETTYKAHHYRVSNAKGDRQIKAGDRVLE